MKVFSPNLPKQQIEKTTIMVIRYLIQYCFNNLNSNPCSFLRCSHSTNNMKPMYMTSLKAIFLNTGMVKILKLQIKQTYSQAIPMLSALKIIHPNTANKNVKNICPASFKVGKMRPSATWFVYLRFFPVRISGRKRMA